MVTTGMEEKHNYSERNTAQDILTQAIFDSLRHDSSHA